MPQMDRIPSKLFQNFMT